MAGDGAEPFYCTDIMRLGYLDGRRLSSYTLKSLIRVRSRHRTSLVSFGGESNAVGLATAPV